MRVIKASLILTVGMLITNCSSSQSGKKSHGSPCFHREECNYTVHLRCLSRQCQCIGLVTEGFPGDYKLQMKWDPQHKMCLSILNSICTGTNESSVPPKKIHAECLPNLSCVQQNDLDMGIGTCQLISLPQQNNPSSADFPIHLTKDEENLHEISEEHLFNNFHIDGRNSPIEIIPLDTNESPKNLSSMTTITERAQVVCEKSGSSAPPTILIQNSPINIILLLSSYTLLSLLTLKLKPFIT